MSKPVSQVEGEGLGNLARKAGGEARGHGGHGRSCFLAILR